MISRFFIDRPIFATVLSIVITLTGGIALIYLPIAQYPRITPPGVAITISYPGANAQEVADTVGAPIEQQVNGIDGMLYMSSQSGNDGSYSLTVTFDINVDIKTALVMVQNRVALAMPQLPSAVQNQGITIRKRTPDMLLIVNFISPDGRYNDEYLSNYATIYCKDELLRVYGISDVLVQGQRDYSMRVWLDPQKLAARNMTAMDVASSIVSENSDAPAGRIGQPPSVSNQAFQYPLDTLGRLTTKEQFGNIVVKVGGKPTVLSRTGKEMGPVTKMTLPPSSSPSPMTPTQPMNGGSSGSMPMTTTSASSDSSTTSAPSPTDLTAIAAGSSSDTTDSSGTTTTSSTGMNSTGMKTTSSTTSNGMPGMSMNGGSSGPPPTVDSLPTPSASVVRLRDVARLELGAQNYNTLCSFDGKPSVGLGLYQLPGTNALDVADAVRAKMEQLKKSFPDGVDYRIAYDTTTFVSDSVNDVKRTLIIAVGLVAIVVMVFLQSWRAAIIPLVAVPVAIIGTFAVMAALGYSLNNISLFGLVLAIGIVVDDAIVVVENVERWMERGLESREATRRAMDETTGPIIAVGLVLCAVFVPCAFISGITGQFFRQFAVTIATSTIFSTINSLTFSPALAAILLKPHKQRRDPLTLLINICLGWFFWIFNKLFGVGTWTYGWMVGRMMRVSVLTLAGYAVLLVLTVTEFRRAPTGFVPQQDQGRLIVNIQLPDAASLERTAEATNIVEKVAIGDPDDPENFPGIEGIAHTITNAGMSFLLQANSPNFASMFIVLKPYDQRQKPHLVDTEIMKRLREQWLLKVPDAQVTVFGSSPIPGIGTAGGFKFLIEDHGGLGVRDLQKEVEQLVRRLNGYRFNKRAFDAMQSHGVPAEIVAKLQPLLDKEFDSPFALARDLDDLLDKNEQKLYLDRIQQDSLRIPGLLKATTQFRANMPQYFLDIDREKVAFLGVSLDDVNQTLDMFLGSLYVNSFNDFGRHWQVTLQADGKYRTRIDNINLFQVRNNKGQMVPLSTVLKVREIGGPISVTRYNLYTSAAVSGNIAPGGSSGDIIATIDKLARDTLPRTMQLEWTELMFMQIRAGNTAIWVFVLSVVCVFLALSALYESWALPLAVILVVPMCLLCSVEGVRYTNRDVNIFVQIGFVVLVGLACKNAILIVEFAKHLQSEGKSCYDATKEASKMRLRPILMTSFAFIFGVTPLMYASGAGQEMRRSLGIAVFSGMLGVTVFGIFLTPVFYYVIQGVGATRLFGSQTYRAISSYVMGGMLGGIVGYSLARLGVGQLPWPPIIGAMSGFLIIRAVLQFKLKNGTAANAGGRPPSPSGERHP